MNHGKNGAWNISLCSVIKRFVGVRKLTPTYNCY